MSSNERKRATKESLQRHLYVMRAFIKSEALSRQMTRMASELDKLSNTIDKVEGIKAYRKVAKRLVKLGAQMLGIPSKALAVQIDALSMEHYWLTQGIGLTAAQTHFGSMAPIRRFTEAITLEYLKVFSSDDKFKPKWVQALSRTQLLVLKKGLLAAIAPILPLMEADLAHFWKEVEVVLDTRGQGAIRKLLRAKQIQINHQYRTQKANNVQFMLSLIRGAGFGSEEKIAVIDAVATAAIRYIDAERLDAIWGSSILRQQLVDVLSRSMGYKPLCADNTPGLHNAWWYDGASDFPLRLLMSGHPVPSDVMDGPECQKIATLNIEQIWRVIAPPTAEKPVTVPVVILSLTGPVSPNINGEADRANLLQSAVAGVQQSERIKDANTHQPQFWLAFRPLGDEAAFSTIEHDADFKRMVGQKAIQAAQIWPQGSLSQQIALAAAHRYDHLYDEVHRALRLYQRPFMGTVARGLQVFKKDETLKLQLMELAAFEQIIIGLSDGVCVTFCEQGMERSLPLLVFTEAIEAFFKKSRRLPTLNNAKDLKAFCSYFAQIFQSKWPQKIIQSANPGKQTFLGLEQLPQPLRAALFRNDWYRTERVKGDLPFIAPPIPETMQALALLPRIDPHAICHLLIKAAPTPLKTLPEQLPSLLLLNADTKVYSRPAGTHQARPTNPSKPSGAGPNGPGIVG
jgi:hypothetical protein